MIHPQRTIRSFVRRDGRMTKGQKQAFATQWATYGIDLSGNDRLDLASLFSSNVDQPQKLIVEIGFGMGHSLLNMAEQFPHYGFLGIEVYRKGLSTVLSAIQARQLNNVRIMSGDAVNILPYIPAHILDAVLIFFPDPWPKQRHHKRRLIQFDFIELLCQKIKCNGYLHIATDWKDYAEHISEVLAQSAHLIDCVDKEFILPRIKTKFEERGQKLGHKIYEFIRIG